MEERMQNTSANANGCPQRDRTASEGYVGAQTYMEIVEGELVEKHLEGESLMEQIIDIANLRKAYRQVVKDNSKKRLLGIPTVIDRMVQQAISQVLSRIYEPKFSRTSYGFRPRRGAHDALREARKNVTEGYKYAVGIDLERFFDTVNQSKLIEVLSRTINDGRVVSLIHKCLRSGVMVHGVLHPTEEGTPQGGPFSPLLSNIMLNELDKELERRGLRFVRYADNSIIFCKSKRSVPLDRPFHDVQETDAETEIRYHAQQWYGVSKPQGEDAPNHTRLDRILSIGRHAEATKRD